MLIELIKDMGHSWKEIAHILNSRFDRGDETD